MLSGSRLVQSLESRILLHGSMTWAEGLSAEEIFPYEVEMLDYEHAYEHYVAAVEARANTAPVPPPGEDLLGSALGPEQVGAWSAAQNWSRVAVHSILLPTGRVLYWDYGDNPRLWNPANGQITSAAPAGYNIFCAGHNLLPDGRVLVAGGHVVNGQGLPAVSIYNPFNNTWQRLPDMNLGRWYPTNTTLANGDTLVISGSYTDTFTNNTLPQVWQQDSQSWRNLTNAHRTLPLYPQMFLAPGGGVFFAGPSVTTRMLHTSGTGQWTLVGNRAFGAGRGYGSAVMYDDGKILAVGGADPPTATAEVINLSASAPAWRAVGSMETQRRQINATILADGQVLVTGGTSGPGFNNTATPVYSAEIWNPVTEQFTTVASMTHPRWYHSTAMLLPDGRVLSAGGDSNPTAELYSPPYLFNGARPTITSAPTAVGYGQTFTIGTPDAANIDKVHLIRLSSVTHAVNMDQRISRLSFTQTQTGGGLQIAAPTNPTLTPPGHYMLFILNGDGVPSVARIVQVAPAVAVEASVPLTGEEGAAPGVFTVTRTGSAIGAMSFAYSIGGTATNGVDYQFLSGSVTIPSGQMSATIEIVPIPDELMEGTETVVLTLASGSSHVVAPDAASATVFIADTPPKVLADEFAYQRLPHELRFEFTRDVSASLDVSDIVVRDLSTNQPMTPDGLTWDAAAKRATFVFNEALPEGNYRATLSGSGIVDPLGTPLGVDHTLDFHFLRGDANGDGQVNLADFNILAAHFGQANRTFSQGDFNYDGLVNLADFNILAARFGMVLSGGSATLGRGVSPFADEPLADEPAGGALPVSL